MNLNFIFFCLATFLYSENSSTAREESLAIEATKIRQARYNQNFAIATGDSEGAAALWTEDITLRRGLGDLVIGKDAYRALIDTAPTEKSLFYTREPEVIEVSPDWPLAYESGVWNARLRDGEGALILSGRYSAQWVKRHDEWLIRSELFVALVSESEANTYRALP